MTEGPDPARYAAVQERLWKQAVSTDPADRAAVEAAVDLLYRQAGLEAPAKVWSDSPRAGLAAARRLLAERENVRDRAVLQPRESMYGRILDHLPTRVWDAVAIAVADQIGRWMVSVQDLLVQALEPAPGADEEARAVARLPGPRRDLELPAWDEWTAVDLLNRGGPGQFGLEELAIAAFAAEEAGVELPALVPLRALAQAGPAWLARGAAVLTERPEALSMDGSARLHAVDAPALRYRDGFAIWAWQGVIAPERVVRGAFAAADIDAEANAELRRIMVERYGAERYLGETGAALVHEDETGALFSKPVPDDEPIVMVRVLNSTAEPDGTRKTYWLRVPPDVKTAREAVAWTFGMRPEEYAPGLET